MDGHHIIVWLIIGLIAGSIAGRVVAGGGFGCLGDTIVGLAGAVIGGVLLSWIAPNRAVDTGGIIGEPRVTYSTPGVDDDTRQAYRRAIKQALDRCTPLPFSAGMGGAIAGRPIAIRFVDNRNQQGPEKHP